MRIYVVIGTTGIYSEQLQWLADAWFHDGLANQRAIELKKLAASFGYRDDMPWKEFNKIVSDMAVAGNGDPNIRWNSGEPALDYFVEECELRIRG